MRAARSKREPTIALINIVFLILVFFMVSCSLSPPLDKNIALINTADLESRPPPDSLVIHSDGKMSFRGQDIEDAATFVNTLDQEARSSIKIIPDRALPAARLVAIGRALREAGADKVVIVSERGLP